MTVSDTEQTQPPEVWALGPTPPPVTGMTLLTERVLAALRDAGPVTYRNWSPGGPGNKLVFRAKRVARTLGCVGWLVAHGRVNNARLYLVCSSKSGLMMTGFVVNIARRLGYRLVLHHHVYYYIDRRDSRMAWIDRSLGPGGVHVVHTPQMARDFQATYHSMHPFICVLPSVFQLPLGQPRSSVEKPFRLGHLGNLMVDKGLDRVLETFQRLRESGRDVRLLLAGPFYTNQARKMVETAVRGWNGCVDYIGPVFGAAKSDFYSSIDGFLFPSRSESWGIVLNEALAAGVPVIACRHGCTGTLVGSKAGLVIDDESRFVELAAKQIETWIDDPTAFSAASQAAIDQSDHLNREGQEQLRQFSEWMFSPASSTVVRPGCTTEFLVLD